MHTRRQFLGAMSLPVGAGALAPALLRPAEACGALAELAGDTRPPREVAADEAYWAAAQRAFTVDRSIINLNNGGVSPAPALVQEAMKRHLDYSNTCPPRTMWRVLEPQREPVRQRLARQWGVDTEEIALTRNASEGLQICQLGLDLARGDQVLTTTQDYPRMLTTFDQRARREGIEVVRISIPVPSEDDAEVVRRFEEAITPRTRVILMCHMINLTGQILPVREVVAMARRHNVPVIVDGAHALAHFDFSLAELDCDYYATSLHKWLFAPHGTGLLYVRKEKIPGLWPMMAAPEAMAGDIRKFEEIGTHPAANYLAIAEALTFNQAIGLANKEARMRHLRDSWALPLMEHDRVRLHTSPDPAQSCGIANVAVEGVGPGDLANHLWTEHRILVTAIGHEECPGIRVSPSVYTTQEELARFVEAMERVIEHGIA